MKLLGFLFDCFSVVWEWIKYPKYMLWITFGAILLMGSAAVPPHPWNYVCFGAVLVICVLCGPYRWS